jgi:hypothetical protein
LLGGGKLATKKKWVWGRHVTLPWEALRNVLEKIASLQGKREQYLELEKAGENLIEVRPQGELHRSPQWYEWSALNSVERLAESGKLPDHQKLLAYHFFPL